MSLKSDAGGADALDAVDAGDRHEGVLQLLADAFDVVDDEGGVDLHHAEHEGLDDGLVLLDLDALGDGPGDGGEDRVDVGGVAGGENVVNGIELDHTDTSGTYESAFRAGVGDALVAALGAAADLDLPALGAFEEGVAVPEEPHSAGRAYLVLSHNRAIMVLILKG